MPKVVWTNEFYVRIYQGAKEGLKNSQIARQLGVAKITFKKWVKKDPAVRDALSQGRSPKDGANGEAFTEYVYKRLPDHLQGYWDELNEWRKSSNSQKRIDSMFDKQGKKVRQAMFLHACVMSNWNQSEACRTVNISKSTLDQWKQEPFFQEIFDECIWHFENFIESSLVKKIRKGDSSAIIFANKTINAKRGYAEKETKQIEVSGHVTHGVMDLNSLDLPPKLMKDIFDHIQKKQQKELEQEESKSPRMALPVHIEDVSNEDD